MHIASNHPQQLVPFMASAEEFTVEPWGKDEFQAVFPESLAHLSHVFSTEAEARVYLDRTRRVVAFLKVLNKAARVKYHDDVAPTSQWTVADLTGAESNQVVRISFNNDQFPHNLVLTEGGIAEGHWVGSGFFCDDAEGDLQQLVLLREIPLADPDEDEIGNRSDNSLTQQDLHCLGQVIRMAEDRHQWQQEGVEEGRLLAADWPNPDRQSEALAVIQKLYMRLSTPV